jgi:hypothetical protein
MIHGPFFAPPYLFAGCGSGRDEEPSGGKARRLIQNPFDGVESGRIYANLSRKFFAEADCGFEFHKRSPLSIGSHNETLSVIPMRVSNPDCSSLGINR